MYHNGSGDELLDAIVVNDCVGVVIVGDLDAERVSCVTTIRCPDHERVATRAVDRPGSLELGIRTGLVHDEELIRTGGEVHPPGVELELRVPFGNGRTLLVFRHEAEGGLATEREVRLVGASR